MDVVEIAPPPGGESNMTTLDTLSAFSSGGMFLLKHELLRWRTYSSCPETVVGILTRGIQLGSCLSGDAVRVNESVVNVSTGTASRVLEHG